MGLKILLADDHRLMRQGLRELISKHIGFEIVGETEDGAQTVRQASKLLPDVIVMDLTMPGLNGIEATRQVLAANPKTKILALSMHSDVRMVTEMLRAGANGYLLKDAAADELIRAINAVSRGQTYLSPAVAGTLVQKHVRRPAGEGEETAFTLLSAREREVLQLLAEGRKTQDIAKQMCISAKTVETHRRNIMQKLNLHSMADLTKYAVREGLTSLE